MQDASPSSTVEQYIKELYKLQGTSGGIVSMKDISTSMDVAPATSTAMIKKLDQQGYVTYIPHKGCRLSSKGEELGINLQRRHRLIEEFLCRILDYDWSETHGEAEQLEHVVSDIFIERVDAKLGYPRFDPHGSPIPNQAGDIVVSDASCLATYRGQGPIRIDHIQNDHDAQLLRYMKTVGILPGKIFVLENNDIGNNFIEMRALEMDGNILLPTHVAENVFVVPEED